jgi:hypothetical protein
MITHTWTHACVVPTFNTKTSSRHRLLVLFLNTSATGEAHDAGEREQSLQSLRDIAAYLLRCFYEQSQARAVCVCVCYCEGASTRCRRYRHRAADPRTEFNSSARCVCLTANDRRLSHAQRSILKHYPSLNSSCQHFRSEFGLALQPPRSWFTSKGVAPRSPILGLFNHYPWVSS